MKKALISPEEEIYHISEGNLLGFRVAQVEDQAFDISEPLFWVDCDENVVADMWYYDNISKEIKLVPLPPESTE